MKCYIIKRGIVLLLIISIIYIPSNPISDLSQNRYQYLRATATREYSAAQIAEELSGTEKRSSSAGNDIETMDLPKIDVEIKSDYARIGDVYLIKPQTHESILPPEALSGGFVIRLEGLSLKPTTPLVTVSDNGNLFHIFYGKGAIAVIMALQALRNRIGPEKFSRLTFLDIGSGTGILGLVAARLGAKAILVDDDSEYKARLESEDRHSPREHNEISDEYFNGMSPSQIIPANIDLNRISDRVKFIKGDVSSLDLNDPDFKGINAILINMDGYGRKLILGVAKKLDGNIKYTFVTGPNMGSKYYHYMNPTWGDPESFVDDLREQGAQVYAFGQTLFADWWPALIYEFISKPTISPNEVRLIKAIFMTLQEGDGKYGLRELSSLEIPMLDKKIAQQVSDAIDGYEDARDHMQREGDRLAYLDDPLRKTIVALIQAIRVGRRTSQSIVINGNDLTRISRQYFDIEAPANLTVDIIAHILTKPALRAVLNAAKDGNALTQTTTGSVLFDEKFNEQIAIHNSISSAA